MSRKKNKKKKNNSLSLKQKNTQQLNLNQETANQKEKKEVSVSPASESSVKTFADCFNKPEDFSFEEKESTPNKNFFLRIVDSIIEKQILSKVFIILFATFVFSYAYKNINEMNRQALSYIGLILCIVVSYVEILGIRDHLWVIEGSIPSSKVWREAFFNPSTIRKYKLRRVIAILFAYIVFAYIYKLKAFAAAKETLSFLGIILMVTIVYYEILAVRDQVDLISKSIKYLIKTNKQGIKINEENEVK